jgi:hypothetical protein
MKFYVNIMPLQTSKVGEKPSTVQYMTLKLVTYFWKVNIHVAF